MKNKQNIHIRKAKPDDAADIVDIQVESWKAAYKNIVPDLLPILDKDQRWARIERWTDSILSMNEDYNILISRHDGESAGFLAYGAPRDTKAGFDAELQALYLHPDFWGQGMGEALFDDMRKRLRNAACKTMYVWVLRDNKIGRRFYEKMGGIHIKGLVKTITLFDRDYQEVAYGWVKI